jgi:flagellar basal body-associated protein FliL
MQSESFIMIEPMYTTIVDEGRPTGMLLVAIGLDIPDRDLRAEADHGMPVLRDDYVCSLMSFTAATVRPARQPDVVAIADRLQRVTDKALHRKGARVLLAQVVIQPKKL